MAMYMCRSNKNNIIYDNLCKARTGSGTMQPQPMVISQHGRFVICRRWVASSEFDAKQPTPPWEVGVSSPLGSRSYVQWPESTEMVHGFHR